MDRLDGGEGHEYGCTLSGVDSASGFISCIYAKTVYGKET